MNPKSTWLPRAINDLTKIRDNGQLSELLQLHANECRDIGLPDYSQAWQPGVGLEAKEIGRAAAQLLGVPQTEAERVVRDLRSEHPRRDLAFELIDEYAGPLTSESTTTLIEVTSKLTRERARRRVG